MIFIIEFRVNRPVTLWITRRNNRYRYIWKLDKIKYEITIFMAKVDVDGVGHFHPFNHDDRFFLVTRSIW